MRILTAVAVVLAACGTLWAAPVTVFHDSFDGYTSWQNPSGGWQNPGTLAMADRGGGNKYLYSVAYNQWSNAYHTVDIDFANVDTITLTADTRSLGCRTWIGLTRASSPTEEMFWMGEYGTSPYWGIKWNGVSYASTVLCDSNWHVLSMVIDQPNDRVDLYIDGGANSIVTVNGLGTNYLDITNVAMRLQKHGTYSQLADVMVQTEIVAPVPEPATMSLLALGGLAALIRRRRK